MTTCKRDECHRIAVTQNGYCNLHEPEKHFSPQSRKSTRGFYSKALPKALRLIYEELDNGEELALSEELTILRTLLIEVLESIDDFLSVEKFIEIQESATAIKTLVEATDGLDKGTKAKISEHLKVITTKTLGAESAKRAKSESRTIIQEIKEVAKAESQIRYNKQTSISAREMQMIMQALIGILVKNIRDDTVLETIRYDIGALLNRGLSSGLGSRSQEPIEGIVVGPSDSNEEQAVDSADSE